MFPNYSFIRLWNYLNIYFLKPFDAVNDTITSDLLLKFGWTNNYFEIGSGDGMFSYVLHGNSFPIWFDRYLNTNLDKKNIFEASMSYFPQIKKKFKIRPKFSVDARKHHILSLKKLGFSKKNIHTDYENIKYKKNSQKLIFFYTPHGLKNYSKSIDNIKKISKKGGRVLILLNLTKVDDCFICYKLQKKFKGNLGNYFKNLDNGRFKETKKLSKSFLSWKKFFINKKFKILNYYSGLSPLVWRIYDIQTRPFLKALINFFNYLPITARCIIKIFWMIIFYPILFLTYIYGSNISKYDKNNCYIAFELKK